MNPNVNQPASGERYPVCLMCGTQMQPLMLMRVRVGGGQGFWGGYQQMDERILTLDTYRCPSCTRLEFFDLDMSMPKK